MRVFSFSWYSRLNHQVLSIYSVWSIYLYKYISSSGDSALLIWETVSQQQTSKEKKLEVGDNDILFTSMLICLIVEGNNLLIKVYFIYHFSTLSGSTCRMKLAQIFLFWMVWLFPTSLSYSADLCVYLVQQLLDSLRCHVSVEHKFYSGGSLKQV